MTTAQRELGPLIAAALIGTGLASIVWAVATKERVDEPGPKLTINTGLTPPAPADEPASDGVSDAEWEKVMIEVEKIRSDGLVEKLDTEAQVAVVNAERWKALDGAAQRAAGRQLAIYCGRVSDSGQHRVTIRDAAGEELGSYTSKPLD